MNKKAIATTVAVMLAISCLTGCAGTGAGTAASTETTTAAQTTESTNDQAVQPAENTTAQPAENTTAQIAEAETETGPAAEAAAGDDGGEVDYTTGTPWPCIDLEGVVTPDMPAELKDNYALYVNKDKILDLEIPEGYSFGGTTMNLMLQQAEDVKEMFLGDAPQEHDARLAYDLFWLMMDWDSRNALGVAPLKENTEKVEQISTIDELMAYFVETPSEKQLGALWAAGPNKDLNNSSRNIIYITDSGLMLKDSAEYRQLTAYGKVKKEAYSTLAKKMLVKLGYSEEEAGQKIDNCFAFETMLADSILTNQRRAAQT